MLLSICLQHRTAGSLRRACVLVCMQMHPGRYGQEQCNVQAVAQTLSA